MHKLYTIISYFLIPIIIINTFIRIFKKKEDKTRYKERFGITNLQKPLGKEVIWIHASSVGEFKSSDFLIKNFSNNYYILVTTTTKTASDYAIKNYGNKIIHQYAVYDVTVWINKFLDLWQPKLVIWIESDLWPNSPARQRVAYDQLLANQLALRLVRNQMRRSSGRALNSSQNLIFY